MLKDNKSDYNCGIW